MNRLRGPENQSPWRSRALAGVLCMVALAGCSGDQSNDNAQRPQTEAPANLIDPTIEASTDQPIEQYLANPARTEKFAAITGALAANALTQHRTNEGIFTPATVSCTDDSPTPESDPTCTLTHGSFESGSIAPVRLRFAADGETDVDPAKVIEVAFADNRCFAEARVNLQGQWEVTQFTDIFKEEPGVRDKTADATTAEEARRIDEVALDCLSYASVRQ